MKIVPTKDPITNPTYTKLFYSSMEDLRDIGPVLRLLDDCARAMALRALHQLRQSDDPIIRGKLAKQLSGSLENIKVPNDIDVKLTRIHMEGVLTESCDELLALDPSLVEDDPF